MYSLADLELFFMEIRYGLVLFLFPKKKKRKTTKALGTSKGIGQCKTTTNQNPLFVLQAQICPKVKVIVICDNLIMTYSKNLLTSFHLPC